MRRHSMIRTTGCGLIATSAALMCLAGCQASSFKMARTGNCHQSTAAHDLRTDGSAYCLPTHQLDARMIRVYWAGENTLAVDNQVLLSSRRDLLRYLSRQDQGRLNQGILLVSASPGPGFDPLDLLGGWCLKHDVNLYCVAMTNGDPAEPVVQDVAAGDWRAELPCEVHWVIQAGPARPAEPRQASAMNRRSSMAER